MKGKLILEDGREIAVEFKDGELEVVAEKKRIVRFKPNDKQHYYYIVSDGTILATHYVETNPYDIHRVAVGNCFETKKEAETHRDNLLKRRQILDRIAELNDGWECDLKDYSQKKYLFYIDHLKNIIRINSCYVFQYVPNGYYLKYKEIGQQLIDEFGDDLKVLFENV